MQEPGFFPCSIHPTPLFHTSNPFAVVCSLHPSRAATNTMLKKAVTPRGGAEDWDAYDEGGRHVDGHERHACMGLMGHRTGFPGSRYTTYNTTGQQSLHENFDLHVDEEEDCNADEDESKLH